MHFLLVPLKLVCWERHQGSLGSEMRPPGFSFKPELLVCAAEFDTTAQTTRTKGETAAGFDSKQVTQVKDDTEESSFSQY